jgi:hypothetical protein
MKFIFFAIEARREHTTPEIHVDVENMWKGRPAECSTILQ